MSKSEDKDRLEKWEDASYTSSQAKRLKVQLSAAIKEAEEELKSLLGGKEMLKNIVEAAKRDQERNQRAIDRVNALIKELKERQRELD